MLRLIEELNRDRYVVPPPHLPAKPRTRIRAGWRTGTFTS
jgi:hypothetical protein